MTHGEKNVHTQRYKRIPDIKRGNRGRFNSNSRVIHDYPGTNGWNEDEK